VSGEKKRLIGAHQPAPVCLGFCSFWSPEAAAGCQTLSFSASFYKIRLDKNYSKST
jgi:hypothetical protein